MSIPTKWFLVGLDNCPFTNKAIAFLESKHQSVKVLKIQRKEINTIQKKLNEYQLLKPNNYNTFPLIWSPIKEFVGGYNDLIKVTFGQVTFSFDKHVCSENQKIIEFILKSLGKIYIPFCNFSKSSYQRKPNHIHMYLDPPSRMQQHIYQNHHYPLQNDMKGFSITFYKNIPRMIYFNETNWKYISHFDNQFNYWCYVVIHEVLHAIGFAYHFNDNYNDLKLNYEIPCKIMTQQTRSRYVQQNVSYFNINNYIKFF